MPVPPGGPHSSSPSNREPSQEIKRDDRTTVHTNTTPVSRSGPYGRCEAIYHEQAGIPADKSRQSHILTDVTFGRALIRGR